MITPRGAALVVVAIALFVLAGATGVGWLLLFDAVLWGILVLSAVMPWIAVGHLDVRRRVLGWAGRADDPSPMEGDLVEFELLVHNRGLLPCIFVSVAYNLVGHVAQPYRERLFLAWLGARQTATAVTRATFDRRGLHELPAVSIETSVPFGLFRRSKRVGASTKLLVLPRVYPVGSLDSLGASGDTEPRPMSARVGEQTAGSRNYLPGDPWAHIHWRNTGRTGQPQVKEFERTPERSLVVAFSVKDMPRDGEDRATEHAARIAASLGDAVCRAGGIVRLLVDGLEVETSDRHRLLTDLALLQNIPDAGTAELLARCPPSSDVVAIVPETSVGELEPLAYADGYHRRVIGLVLRGFQTDASDRRPMGGLSLKGVSLTDCWPDRIPGGAGGVGWGRGRSRGQRYAGEPGL